MGQRDADLEPETSTSFSEIFDALTNFAAEDKLSSHPGELEKDGSKGLSERAQGSGGSSAACD